MYSRFDSTNLFLYYFKCYGKTALKFCLIEYFLNRTDNMLTASVTIRFVI